MNLMIKALVVLVLYLSIGFGQEHPRLLIHKADLPVFREKLQREPYASMLTSLQEITGHEAEMNNKDYGLSFQLRNYAALFLCTGDDSNKDTAMAICRELIGDSHWWNKDYKGLTRQAYAVAVAFAYDAFYDVWSQSDRQFVSDELMKVANTSWKTMGVNAATKGVSNWQAVRWGGCGLCWLACDENNREIMADSAYDKLINKHFKENLGSNQSMGTNPEGYGYTIYSWQFAGPFAAAYERLRGKAIRDDYPPAARQLWSALLMTLYQKRPANMAEYGIGLKPDWSDDNVGLNPKGTAGISLTVCNPDMVPGLKWIYDHAWGAHGSQLYDRERGNTIYSIIFYPDDIQSVNPAYVWGLTYLDSVAGMIAFRNQYKDENDILVAVNAKRHPKISNGSKGFHNGRDANGIRVWGLNACWITGYGRTQDPQGHSTLFPRNPDNMTKDDTYNSYDGVIEEYITRQMGDGSSVTIGSNMRVNNHRRMMGVDYSGESGAAALIILADKSDNGDYWRINTPEYNNISTNGDAFTITSPDGHFLEGTVLHPSNPSFSTGSLDRHGDDFPFGTQTYGKNKWIQMTDSQGDFLIVMTLNQEGQAAPSVSSSGSGLNRTIDIGSQNAVVTDERVTIDWPEDQVVTNRPDQYAHGQNLLTLKTFSPFILLTDKFSARRIPAGAQRIELYSVNGTLLKSYTIDSQARNSFLPFEISRGVYFAVIRGR